MRVFVTGATGAIGRRVVPLLRLQGHEVSAVGHAPERLAALRSIGASAITLDLFDPDAVARATAGHDAVINLATQIPGGLRALLARSWDETNRIRHSVSAVLASAALANGIERFVQESFAPAYPDSGDQWIFESTPLHVVRYNWAVADAERAAAQFTSKGGIGIALRFALLYGPGDQFTGQVFKAVRHGWLPFFGQPEAFVSLVTHEDAAAAVVAALHVPAGAYNVVDDAPLRRGELAAAVGDLLGVARVRPLPGWATRLGGSVGETLARSVRISNEKLKAACTWSPAMPDAKRGFAAAFHSFRRPPVDRQVPGDLMAGER
jgi:nucleoside-diphosphate-sugar epimerase